jgi:hypothetical protein
VLIAISKPPNEARPARMDYRGLALIVGGVGLSVFGLQQSALWGWGNPAIWASIPYATTAPASASPSWARSLINQFRSAITSSLTDRGLRHAVASAQAAKIAQLQGR